MKCWGDNFNGQLGDGTNVGRLTPVDVSGLTSGVTSMSVGLGQTCAVTSGGGAKCWGYNDFGELGDGTTTDRLTPVDVSGLTSGVATISAHEFHTCAVTTAGGAKCWGFNYAGALGDGTQHRRLTPVDVAGLTSGIATISTGADYTCALTTAGAATCWGRGFSGQIGDGSTGWQLLPVDVYGLPVIRAPRLVRFSPKIGSVGTRLRVFGKNFIDVASVSFHGSAARSFRVLSNTTIVVRVPRGANTGKITVTTAGGKTMSRTTFVVTRSRKDTAMIVNAHRHILTLAQDLIRLGRFKGLGEAGAIHRYWSAQMVQ